ncbi:T9SS type A sorting domain-containing protein [Dyadobacter sp. CY323]|uniref:T9SS type A sorting domain-containing protein n=1 Tax=Dyadobacter sp. CY323 TaxID=2907302 RepID=UPI001F385969|nr:T9SS type A sorting domain-containing protein [Dyadobacter sp. CY323]MCE6991403.1 T9SS type A sorting domain-containing protein [Dyadobacter sp. CY323]
MDSKPLQQTKIPVFKILQLLAAILFSGLQYAHGQIYSHNFNGFNLNTPQIKNEHFTASWSSEGGTGGSGIYARDNGIAIVGQNHVYILTLAMTGNYQTSLSSIALSYSAASNQPATFQIKVNEEDYGNSFYSNTGSLQAVTRSVSRNNLRGTITIRIEVQNGNLYYQNYTTLDNLVIRGTVSEYDPASEAEPDENGVLYVDKDTNLPGNGSSWNASIKELHDAIRAAQTLPAVKQIWVAEGEYQPAGSGQSFGMVNGIKIYGGFEGYETEISGRLIHDNATYLKGTGASVISNENINNTALLDGFYITGGSGQNAAETGLGGGMYNNNSSPVIANCTFLENQTNETRQSGRGGAVYNKNSNPAFIQTLFLSNKARGTLQGEGGAIFNEDSSPVITNCTFTRNEVSGSSTSGNGAAIASTGSSSPQIRNCIIWNNPDSGQTGGTSSINNVGEMTGAPIVAYSLVQGGYTGGDHIVDADPLFENPDESNFKQQRSSPVVNAGDPATDLSLFPTENGSSNPVDYNLEDRVKNGRIDMGIHEVFRLTYWHVNAAASSENADGVTWETAFPTFQQALSEALPDDQIWVARGEYQPASGEYFEMKTGVKIYGGFLANETTLDQRPRPVAGNAAIASVLKGNGNSVIRNDYNNLDSEDLLDGFTITGGEAEEGGGVYNQWSSPTFYNCSFINNKALANGGGMFHSGGQLNLYSCSFITNASEGNGGGLYVQPEFGGTILNSVFDRNNAVSAGGGIWQDGAGISLINVTLSGNTAESAGGIASGGSGGLWIFNSIIYGNSSGIVGNVEGIERYFSLVQGFGANPDYGNLNGSLDPQFSDALHGDLTLRACSPLINRGNTESSYSDLDRAGNPRIYNAAIDLGAFELQSVPEAGSLSSSDQNTTEILSAGVTPFGINCETIALIEPLDEELTYRMVTVKNYLASGQTIIKGKKVFVKRHFDITPSKEGSANVTLFFTKQEFDDYNTAYGNANNSRIPENLKIVQYHGTSSTGEPESYTGKMEIIKDIQVQLNTEGTIYAVKFAVSGFSGFFATGQSEAALPVTLASFEAAKQENHALLQWTTSAETNSREFEIQRSVNGKQWLIIGKVAASGESSVSIPYSFTDHQPERTTNLYRLMMIDADESYTYSSIRAVDFTGNLSAFLYPNPAVQNFKINLAKEQLEQISAFKICDQQGKTVLQSRITSHAQVDVSSLKSGSYMVIINYKNGATRSEKVVIAR